MARPRIVLADDHELVLEAFSKLLATAYDVVGKVTDGRALIDAVEKLAPELVIVDLGMPNLNGLDAIERIKKQAPRIRIVALTMESDADTAADAIRRGASGYVLKSSPASELFEALSVVLNGDVFVTEAVAQGPSSFFAAEATRGRRMTLSLRQREVLQLLAEGLSMKEAAAKLDVTPRTIAFHKYSIMEQLGCKSSAELVQHAIALGLVKRQRSPYL